MKNIMKKQIKNLFINPQQTLYNGLWFSGHEGEGEYKEWYSNGELAIHCFYENGEREGEYKEWYENGQLDTHCFYKDDLREGEYKSWYYNGELWEHCFYKNGKIIKDYLK